MSRGRDLSMLVAVLILPAAYGCSSGVAALSARNSTAPMSGERLQRIAETFEAQGDYRKAQELYATVLERAPQNAAARERWELLAQRQRENNLPDPAELRPLAMSGRRGAALGHSTANRTTVAKRQAIRRETREAIVASAAAPTPKSGNHPPQRQVAAVVANGVPPSAPEDPELGLPEEGASTDEALRDELETVTLAEEASLGEQLKNMQPRDRAQAVRKLGQCERHAPETLWVLQELLRDESPVVRAYAAEAIWRISGEATESVPVLLAVLGGDDRQARQLAAFVLGRMGPDGAAAIPELWRQMQLAQGGTEEELLARVYLAEAVARIDGNNRPAMNELIRLLQTAESKDRSVNLVAALALAELPIEANDSIGTALRIAAGSADREIREAAVLALSVRDTNRVPEIVPANSLESRSETTQHPNTK